MSVHRNEADAALVMRIAEGFENPRLRNAEPMRARQVEAHQVAVVSLALVARLHSPTPKILTVDRRNQTATMLLVGAVDAEQAALLARQLADRRAFETEALNIRTIELA